MTNARTQWPRQKQRKCSSNTPLKRRPNFKRSPVIQNADQYFITTQNHNDGHQKQLQAAVSLWQKRPRTNAYHGEKKTQIKLKCMPDINKFARMKRTARPTFCRKVNNARSKMNRRRCSRDK
jgi:hypothetical protein